MLKIKASTQNPEQCLEVNSIQCPEFEWHIRETNTVHRFGTNMYVLHGIETSFLSLPLNLFFLPIAKVLKGVVAVMVHNVHTYFFIS